jgi:hypothetical protein
MNILKISFVTVLTACFVFATNYIDTIEMAKIKKLVEKEEQIAKAYGEYVKYKGTKPASIDSLITNGNLGSNFDKKNPFTGVNIRFADDEVEENLPLEIKSKSFLYDYYYSNANRIYTKAPISKQSKIVEIVLSSYEKYILKYQDVITTNYANRNNKYYLDSKGILHWYDSTGNYKFSFGKDLIVDENVNILDSNGDVTTEFKELVNPLEATYAGQIILHIKSGVAKEYINLGTMGGIVKIGVYSRDIGKTIVQFSRRSGGIMINGDIYTWGNNSNRITPIYENNYTEEDGTAGARYPIVTGMVRARAKTKDYTDIDDLDYYSSPLRPKFIDFFSSVFHSTCGITIKGELYCGGKTAALSGITTYNQTYSENGEEALYKSKFFDGSSGKKATKVFANNQLWLFLANANSDGNGGYKDGQIYRWGYDDIAFSGKDNAIYLNRNNPTELEVTDNGLKVLFKDLTYLLSIGHRKVGALSNEGNVWIWGVDKAAAALYCSSLFSGVNMNLCKPSKVDSTVKFATLKGGMRGFVAKGENGIYYRIRQKWGEMPSVASITDMIKVYNGGTDNKYIESDDTDILAVDLSSKLNGTSLEFGEGIVWVNGKNELKGDYFTAANKNDTIFKASIKKIKWKNIKVVEDENAMCGIDIYNQMYCWGIVSYYSSPTEVTGNYGNTYMLPVFNTNLYDLDKDYLISQGGDNTYVTNMTSGEWSTTDSEGHAGAFFMKYPTYIGGFNYEFTFK